MTAQEIRLLIAEDMPLLRRALRATFENELDISIVAEAADGVDAVKQARAWRPNVALLDIKMPRLNGIEAARQICDDNPECKVVMLTTFDTEDLIFDAIAAGAIGYLLKETEESEVVATVREAAAGRSRMSPSVARKVIDDFRRVKRGRPKTGVEPDDPLTEREGEILDLIGKGKSNKDIGLTLSLAEGTVKNHVSSILSKFHARSRTELVVKVSRDGDRS